jgi:hypothetical protein
MWQLKRNDRDAEAIEHRQVKYLNNRIPSAPAADELSEDLGRSEQRFPIIDHHPTTGVIEHPDPCGAQWTRYHARKRCSRRIAFVRDAALHAGRTDAAPELYIAIAERVRRPECANTGQCRCTAEQYTLAIELVALGESLSAYKSADNA